MTQAPLMKRTTETVYDADGKAYELELVDAREYLASGSYFREPPKPLAAAPIPSKTTPNT